jgi:thiol:disulfide interchange protein DsbC
MKKLLISLLILSATSFAIDAKLNSGIRQSLKGTLPKVNIDSISDTPVANLYQVVSGKKVFYVDSSGRYLLVGNLIDLATQNNLTKQQVEKLEVVNWDELPLNLAIRRVNGDGKRRIAIFSDPDCQFCKNLERETIPKLSNVTIYYFMFPLPTHQNAKLHAKQILCSEMAESAFTAWMNNGDKLQDNTGCDKANNLETMLNLGKNLGVEETPTIILPDGKVVVGLVPPDYLNQLITNAMPDVVNIPASESKLVASGVVQNKSK